MARRLAVEKAEAIAADHPNRVVLGADTIVVFGGEPLGKPIDPDDAVSMLRKLSGRRHQAVTGWAVWSGGQTTAGRTVTDVSFRSLQDAEIAAYVASGEPLDKAGAYAIQGGAAGFVDGIHGSFRNVVGLPIDDVAPALAAAGVHPTQPVSWASDAPPPDWRR